MSGVLEFEVGQAELDFKLRFNEILPGLAQLDIGRLNLQRPEDLRIIVGAEDSAMVGNHHRRAPILGQSREEPLEHGGESWWSEAIPARILRE